MSDKIKKNEEIETKNLESIPGENDLPDVKSKEHYEKLVIERRLNSYEKSKNAQEAAQEVSTEDLNDVAGGKIFPLRRRKPVPKPILYDDTIRMRTYAGPCKEPSILPEVLKKLQEEKERKEKEKKHEEEVKQGLSIGVEQDNLTR